MTDEKMAEEYVDTILNKDDSELDKFLDENLEGLELNKRQAGTILGIIKGVGICSYLAGLKAGRPEWHKVADGDLPKETEFVESDVLLLLVQLKGTKHKRYELGRYNFSANVFSYTHLKSVEDVVAWCEIPKYTEE